MSNRESVVSEIGSRRISAIIRTQDETLARDAMKAAVAGGIRLAEFTLTTPGALDLITEFAEDPDLLVGAGTVLTREQAQDAVKAGAQFLVAPTCELSLISEARALDVASIPGTFTPTEMLTAHRAGADFVKLFPAPADVADYVRSTLLPLPELRIFPTAGVFLENFVDILQAGAAGVAFVRSLFEPEWMDARNFAAIERRAQQVMQRFAEM